MTAREMRRSPAARSRTPATIAQRNVTASISALDKTYDGTRDATIPSCTVEAQSGDHGVVSPDVVGCDASNGKFATKDAGSQSVSADVALNGGDDQPAQCDRVDLGLRQDV